MSIPEQYREAAARLEAEARSLWDSLHQYSRPALSDEAWRRQWEAGLWRVTLYEAGEDYPEEIITRRMLQETPPGELPALLWEYLRVHTDRAGWNERGAASRQLIHTLPRGLRITYTLTVLDSEIYNGGLQQFFTNSSGELATEALEDLERIGAEEAQRVFAEALRLNEGLESRHESYRRRFEAEPQGCGIARDEVATVCEDFEANLEPEFERLTKAWFRLSDSPDLSTDPIERVRQLDNMSYLQITESPWKYFERYAAAHPDEFVHPVDSSRRAP
jgi:hypothetical protein